MRALLLMMLAVTAHAADWFDPSNGCGRSANFAKSGKATDLPGCTGKIPKDAPQVENVLHDAKQLLVEAEERLAKGKLDKIDALLASAKEKLAHAPPVSPDMPDRWEQSQPQYERAIASLQNRVLLSPHLPALKSTHEAALQARAHNDVATDGGPAAALAAGQACVSAFDPVRKLDLSDGGLTEWLSDCENLKKAAAPLVTAQAKAKKAQRTKLRAAMKGDRRKVFDQHPDALPEINGNVWKYGKQTFTFKGNKLVSSK